MCTAMLLRPWSLCCKTMKQLQSSSATNEWRRVEGMGWQVQDHPRQGGVPLRWAGLYVDAAEQDGGPPRLLRRRWQRPALLEPGQDYYCDSWALA